MSQIKGQKIGDLDLNLDLDILWITVHLPKLYQLFMDLPKLNKLAMDLPKVCQLTMDL